MKRRSILVAAVIAVAGQFMNGPVALAEGPPLQDMKLWLKTDTGVVTNSDGSVVTWLDQTVAPVIHNGIPLEASGGASGLVYLTTKDFPIGTRSAITFDGTAGIVCTNRDDLQTPAVSLYVVGSANIGEVLSGCFIANTRPESYGWILGVSDTVAGRARWYTGLPAQNMEPATGADLQNGVSYLIEGTFANNSKRLFINGTQVGSETCELSYATWSVLGVGCEGLYPSVDYEPTPQEATLSKILTGDITEVLTYSSASDAQRLAVEAYFYQKYFAKPGTLGIAKAPVAQTVNEGEAVTFSVNADGTGPLTFEWSNTAGPIPDSNNPYYTIPIVNRTHASQFSVKVTNASGSVTSTAVNLTVIPDTTPPVILAADRDLEINTKVEVLFSKALSAATATVSDNYSIDNGVAVSSAVMGATPDTVILTTSAITYGPAYTLTVNNVQDLVGNQIVANSTRRVTVPDPNAPVPQKNLKMWLRADVGVSTNEDGLVTAWADRQVGSPNKDGVPRGNPTLASADFSNGPHPAVWFDGSGTGFVCNNPSDLAVTNLSMYVVCSIQADGASKIFCDLYRDVVGYGLGIADTIANRVKWFTAPPNSMEPELGQLEVGTQYMLLGTYKSVGGVKKLWVNGALAGEATKINLGYGSGMVLSVGCLQGTGQFLNGTISEILVYGEVSDAQQDLVEAYLNRKYFGQGSGPATIVFEPSDTTVNELSSVTFEVGYEGEPPVAVQWYKNNQLISGATSPVYTIPSVTRADQGAEYYAHVSNAQGQDDSRKAKLTVILDEVAPVLGDAKREYSNDRQVIVTFSKALASSTATVAGNYSISGAIGVSTAAMGPGGTTVILTTASAIAAGTTPTLTVNNVTDLVGNKIADNSQTPIQVPTTSLQPPTADLEMWLTADKGVTTAADGKTVTAWEDQAAVDYPHDAEAVIGKPELAVVDFYKAGLTRVIHFNGSSGFRLANYDSLQPFSISVYVVGSLDVINASRVFVFNYSDVYGWGMGISDGTAGRVKWFSSENWNPNSMEPEAATFVPNTPMLMMGTLGEDGEKRLWWGNELGSTVVGTASGQALGYGGSMQLNVGCIVSSSQFLVGTIAEILVYKSVSDTQRTAVQEYLTKKYFGAPPPPSIAISRANMAVVEAEHFTANNPVQWHSWTQGTTVAGASGGAYMEALPNASTNVQNDITISPRLDFKLNFPQAGTYYVWLRGLGDSAPGASASDSVHVGLDGVLPETSRRISGFPDGSGFVWSNSRVDPAVDIGAPRFDVTTAGEHVVNVWMREDGFILDKLIITSSADYKPSGMGPAEASGASMVVVSWDDAGAALQKAPVVNDKNAWQNVSGAASPWSVAPTAAKEFYRLSK